SGDQSAPLLEQRHFSDYLRRQERHLWPRRRLVAGHGCLNAHARRGRPNQFLRRQAGSAQGREFNMGRYSLQSVGLASATIPPSVIELVPESVARENVVI